jgi:hypothetical protein
VGGLLFVSLVMIAVTTDLALLHAAYRQTSATADFAAEAGAGMFDQGSLHAGVVELDSEAAERTARDWVERSTGDTVEVTVDGSEIEICVTVARHHRTTALSPLGIRSVVVRVRSCAKPATG